MLEQH